MRFAFGLCRYKRPGIPQRSGEWNKNVQAYEML